ncbi:MAG: CHAP domain-containing protein [Mogibacterium sp.]|nr:CHAP domain-containing protein [Mogibacterium sp.]
MKSMTGKNVKRTLLALLLMFVLSFTTVFSETDPQTENAGGTGQTEVSAETGEGSAGTGDDGTGTGDGTSETGGGTTGPGDGTAEVVDTQPEIAEVESPALVPAARPQIIKKGRYYYYKYASGKIRRKAGFVTVDGKRYYVRKGGKIRTSKTFKVKKKYYRANKYGVIKTGVYKWNGYLYYSSASGVLRKKAGFVTWNGNRYYVRKGGKIVVNDGFSANNIPYAADAAGHTRVLAIPDGDGSPVIDVAKAHVGIMTGKTYWVWYYKTRFRDTDRTPWCGAFVAWVYNAAGLYDKITVARKYGPLGYVPSYSRYANKYNKWVSKSSAKGGDIIIFGRNMHVGLVEGITEDYIITIEGNAGPTAAIGCGKPGAVVRNVYKISNKKIKGIIRP